MSETVKVGIVGIGNMGSAHAKSIFSGNIKGMELAAVCDIAESKRLWADENLPGVPCYEDYKEMIDSGVCDTVIVATPHYFHSPIAIYAFEKGKNVLTEKPAGVYTKQVEEMNAAAKKSGKVFGIMYNQRTNPKFQKMREIVQSGELGQLKRSIWIVTNWYRTNAYYASGAWRASWKGEGGGLLLNQAAHNLDLWQWICGMPVSVTAHCNVGKFHDIEVEDEAVLYTEFAGGATGVFITTTGDLPGTNRLEIVGTLGKIVIEGGTLKHWKLPKSEREICADAPESCPRVESEYTEYTPGNGRAHAGILQNYANALLHGEALIAPGYDGLMQITLINAAYLSAWSGSAKVTLPFDKALYDKLLAEKIAHSSFRSEVKPLAEDKEQSNRWQVNW